MHTIVKFLCVTAMLVGLGNWSLSGKQSDGAMRGHSPTNVAPEVWSKIAPQLDVARYAFEADETGAFKARNPAHGFDITADEAGVRVKDSVVLRAVKAGMAGAEQDLPQNVMPTARGARLEYERGNVIEWFENRADGLEQGFTIAEVRNADCGLRNVASELQLLVDVAGARAVTVNADGLSARITDEQGRDFGYGGLKAWDSTGRMIECRMRIADCGIVETEIDRQSEIENLSRPQRDRNSQILLVCDTRGAVWPVTIDPVLISMEKKLEASDGDANDWFGWSVSVAGDVALVGAYGDETSKGAAYVFERNAGGTNAWGEVKKLTASDGTGGNEFGNSVSVAGDVALVGAKSKDSSKGAAYVFERNAGGTNAWGEVKKLTASDGAADDNFGNSVSVAGDVALVGAYADDDRGLNAGAAYVFERNVGGTNAWGQVTKLTASDGAMVDYFGNSVSVAGDVALVGARGDDSEKGAAYVFERNAGGTNAWAQVVKLMASDGADYDNFGQSVSVAGDVALIGANGNDSGRGAAYVFQRNAGGANAWGEVKKLTASDGAGGDSFGVSVSVAGDVAFVGAKEKDTGKGAAYVFQRNAGGANAWGEVKKLTASAGAGGDSFGVSVSMTEGMLLCGASGKDTSKGAAYLIPYQYDEWNEKKKLTVSDGEEDDQFGWSVSVAGDVALVGANGDDSGRGAAYVFERNAGGANTWGQVAKLTASDGVMVDFFGNSVSVAGDVALVGARGDDSEKGAAYVFERNAGGTNAWGQVVKLMASDGGEEDNFGCSVSMAGDVALVGANGDDSEKGAAYVFERNAGGTNAWGQVAKLTAFDSVANHEFGNSVSVAGDVALVGAHAIDFAKGAAYVFQRNAGGTNAWGEVKKMTASDGVGADHFGWSVSVAGDVAFVGALLLNDPYKGAAYVFERNAGGTNAWAQVAKLEASDGATWDYFGCSVSVAGDVALIGAVGYDSLKGAAYMFEGLLHIPEPNPVVLGTNGAAVASGEPAVAAKGTDFGAIPWGSALTNTFSITNSGDATLTISGVTTNGAGAAAFSISDFGFSIDAGSASNFNIGFAPPTVGTYTAAVHIANNSTNTPYIVYLAGTGAKQDQAALTFNPASPQTFNTTNELTASGGSGTGVVSYAVQSGSGQIIGANGLKITSGIGDVVVVATKAADDMYNAIAATGTVTCAKADQTLDFPAISDQALTNTLNLSATASSGLAVSFSNTPGSPVSWVDANTLTFTAAGTVGIVASQAGNDDWNAAPDVTHTFSVTEQGKQDQTIDFPLIPPQQVTSVVALDATASSGLAVEFDVVSGPGAIEEVAGARGAALLSFTGPGIVLVKASQAGDAQWNPAPAVTNSVVVTAAPGHGYVPGDFDGDGCTDLNVYYADPYWTLWYSLGADGRIVMWAEPWGGNPAGRMMRPVLGDYDGDGIGDPCMYDEQTGFWFIRTLTGEILAGELPWGGPGFIPVAGDYDGDGLWDLCVYGEAVGLWYARSLAGDTLFSGVGFGGPGFAPMSGDYDGDGTHDLVVCYHDAANAPYWIYWYGWGSTSGEAIFWAAPWGDAGWVAVEGDYDGDGAADLCVYDPATGAWYAIARDGTSVIVWGGIFGGPGFTPVAGDYDGDGVWDLAVYEQDTGLWYIRTVSGAALVWGASFGGPELQPW